MGTALAWIALTALATVILRLAEAPPFIALPVFYILAWPGVILSALIPGAAQSGNWLTFWIIPAVVNGAIIAVPISWIINRRQSDGNPNKTNA